jgi:SAM-dependent methyltransferase
MKDAWESGNPYEYFMGRWSRLVARSFIDWLSPSSGLRWLDVGCGTGALCEVILNDRGPSELIAVDQSQGFIDSVKKKLGTQVRCEVGDALDLPLAENSVGMAVSGLVLNFIPDPVEALGELKRVTCPGGTVAVYVWDYSGKMEFLRYFWDAVVEQDPGASGLHEGMRFPDSNEEGLRTMFTEAGLSDVTLAPIEVDTVFANFEDYWKPFLGGQGPAPTYLLSLDDIKRDRLRDVLKERLPVQPDGSIHMIARAWAARGEV